MTSQFTQSIRFLSLLPKGINKRIFPPSKKYELVRNQTQVLLKHKKKLVRMKIQLFTNFNKSFIK